MHLVEVARLAELAAAIGRRRVASAVRRQIGEMLLRQLHDRLVLQVARRGDTTFARA